MFAPPDARRIPPHNILAGFENRVRASDQRPRWRRKAGFLSDSISRRKLITRGLAAAAGL